MAPTPSILMSSGSKKKEPRYLGLSEAKASHSPKICAEVSSSVPHFLQVELLLSPITCRCLLMVLCPVSRPITALDCVLLKDNEAHPASYTIGKAAGAWRWPPTPSSAEVKERVALYLYTPSGPSWPVLGWTLLTYLLTYSMEQSPSWEANWFCS